MLTEQEDKGFLIDFDLAIKTGDIGASGAPSKTGTKVFMAIRALLGEDHTFMDDQESIFWALFWICIHWNGPGKKARKSEFEEWNYLSTTRLARDKAGLVSTERDFDSTVERSFSDCCQIMIPCMRELRRVVFPGGSRWDREDRKLYSRMRAVLEKARDDPKVLATM
jgi:hypothetical protein